MFGLCNPGFPLDQGVSFLLFLVETLLFDLGKGSSNVPGVSSNRLRFGVDVGLFYDGFVLDREVVAKVGDSDRFCEKSSGVKNPFFDLSE